MRLISARREGRYERYEMHEFFGYDTPNYAILSHTWGEEEVSFQEMQHLNERTKKKQGFKKIAYTCDQAEHDGLSWVWIDTCCIDKSSSAELTEAINSMYGWYSGSATCYAYLVDVPLGDDQFAEQWAFRRSRWFTRGWTIQELIAPREVNFYNKEWRIIGSKHSIKSAEYPGGKRGSQESLGRLLESITGIPEECLVEYRSPSSYSVAKRMSWASKRQCTRVEDVAYSLMGIFGVNMPLLYGEGRRAFVRLQEEIMKETDDHSLFAWTVPEESNESLIIGSVFAQSPVEFARSSDIIPVQEELGELSVVTRKGLKISLNLQPAVTEVGRSIPGAFYAALNCARALAMTKRIAIMLIPDISANTNQPRSLYRCATTENIVVRNNDKFQTFHTIYIYKNVPAEILQIFSPSFSERSILGHADSGLSMVRRLHHLASILASQRNYDKAEALCRQILYRLEKELGNDHPSTLVSLSNLASILQSLGKYKEAEALHRRVLEGREMALAKDHSDTLTSLENLALILQGLRKYEEAETLHRQVLKRREDVLGKNHWDTLTSLNNLASVLCDLGKHEEAEAFHRLASEGREIVLGRIHPDTLKSLNNLASVLSVLGNYEEAGKIRRRSNDIIESHDPYRRKATVSSIFNSIPPTTSTVLDGQTDLAPQTLRLYYPGLGISGNITENGVYVRSENKWINCMEGFAAFIQTVPPQSARPVKIAVLDCGFDDSPYICDDRFAWVTSWPRKNSTGMLNMYFSQHSGKRWTRMSALISQICPRSRLYVGLLEESSDVNGNSGRLWATLESVVEAIRWAIECGVDIISIACGVDENSEYANLGEAMQLAKRRGVLFCSPEESLLRLHYEDSGLFCKSARGSQHLSGRNFLFPGGDIAFVNSDGVNVSYESGDIVATAVASGLAGQVIYCSGLVGKTYDWWKRRKRGRLNRIVMLPDIGSFLERNHKTLLLYHEGKGRETDLGNSLLDNFLNCCRLYG